MHRRLRAVNNRERNIDSCCVAWSSCAIKKNVIVASQLYDVADLLRIFLTIAVNVAT